MGTSPPPPPPPTHTHTHTPIFGSNVPEKHKKLATFGEMLPTNIVPLYQASDV